MQSFFGASCALPAPFGTMTRCTCCSRGILLSQCYTRLAKLIFGIGLGSRPPLSWGLGVAWSPLRIRFMCAKHDVFILNEIMGYLDELPPVA